MKFEKQNVDLSITNFDSLMTQQKGARKRHGELLPNNIRAIFCGPSNCGKTNTLLSLITHPKGLSFENVYVYSKSLEQPKYQFLKFLLKPLSFIKYFPFKDHDAVISVDKVLPNSLMILDDIACEKQDTIKNFFSMGRHKNLDCFYLCQSYASIPKHLIRDNVNLLVLFRQDDMNLKHVHNDHVTTDMSYSQFKDLCSTCWNDDKYGFLVIDKESGLNSGRYRKGFDHFLINISRSK